MDLFQTFPGAQPDQEQQADHHCALHAHALFTARSVKRNQRMEEILEFIHAGYGQG